MSTAWHLLNPTPSDIDLPPLLISTHFTFNSYTIHVTDCTYIWTESLDRRAIIKRSLEEDTSIDPSEDAEQLRVFLEKIQSALGHAKGTSLALRAFPPKDGKGSGGPPDLDLVVTVQLPKPLKALKWPVELKVAEPAALRSSFVIPLLTAQNARMKELNALVELLRDKDHVIEKLVDKLEATGAELGHVFPGAAGKGGRKLPRKMAEDRVKGLGKFDLDDWRKSKNTEDGEEDAKDYKSIMKSLFKHNGGIVEDDSDLAQEVSKKWDTWWNCIKDVDVVLGVLAETKEEQEEKYGESMAKGKCMHEAREELDRSEEEEQPEDFQIQSTPPRGRNEPKESQNVDSSQTIHETQGVADSADDDDDNNDDLDGPSQRSAVPDSYEPPSTMNAPKKLGSLGRGKAPAKSTSSARTRQKSPVKASQPTQEQQHVEDDEETASEANDDDVDPLPPPKKHTSPAKPTVSPKSSPPKPPPSKKGGLGRVGGKKKDTNSSQTLPSQQKPSIPPRDVSVDPPDRTPKKRLGVIGHRAAPTGTPEPEQNDRGRTAEKEEEKPRETSKERADRKRAELKRELEEKAKQPVKKKRRF
jgi:hypothetical protein